MAPGALFVCQVHAQRMGLGVTQWPQGALLVCQVYGQRVGLGVIQWPQGARLVCQVCGQRVGLCVCDVMAPWGAFGCQVYGQRVASGLPQWHQGTRGASGGSSLRPGGQVLTIEWPHSQTIEWTHTHTVAQEFGIGMLAGSSYRGKLNSQVRKASHHIPMCFVALASIFQAAT